MKNVLLIAVFLLLKMAGNAQGIKFEERLSWKQIKEKAKNEHKAIFLDCFTTWCAPCRTMDQDIYPQKVVGDYFNSRFISVKMQMDKTSLDDSLTKARYVDAGNMQRDYSINAYPSLLFFSPDGKPLHKVVGSKTADGLIGAAKDAFDPNKQLYAILNNFQPGKMDTAEMKGLARSFQYSDKVLADKIALDYLTRIPVRQWGNPDNLRLIGSFANNPAIMDIAVRYISSLDHKGIFLKKNTTFLSWFTDKERVKTLAGKYLSGLSRYELSKAGPMDIMSDFKEVPQVREVAVNYIHHLTKKQVYQKSNLLFIASFTSSPTDSYFNLFFKEGKKVDLVVKEKNYSRNIVDGIIWLTDVKPKLDQTNDAQLIPDFNAVYQSLIRKYGIDYADRNILSAKISFYNYRASKHNLDWDKYLDYAIEQKEKYGVDTTGFMSKYSLNGLAWDGVFMHSTNTQQLRKMIGMMRIIFDHGPDYQYKKEDYPFMDTYANLLYKAGNVPEALEWESKAVKGRPGDKEIEAAYGKMLKGEPTWPVPSDKEAH